MTIIFSAATQQLIVMTVDSVITKEFENETKFEKGRKYYPYQGVGCVTTWGERVGNKIGSFLEKQEISPDKHSILELSGFIIEFLRDEYKAHDPESDDIGYHVAGFDREGHAKIYHVFWGFPRPNLKGVRQNYYPNDHSPTREIPIQLLYNGRNDIADTVVKMLIKEIEAGKDVKFDLKTPIGLASFGDFVARMAGELTPEVGPPFYTILISPTNEIRVIMNDSFHPLDHEKISKELVSLGFKPSNSGSNSTQKAAQQKLSVVKANPLIAPSGISMPRSSFNNSCSTTKLRPYNSEAGTVSHLSVEE